MSPSARRSGWLLVEMVLALTMAAVVIGSLATLISGGVRWTRSLSDQTEALEVARTVWVVVEDEVRTARAGRDWRVDETGALALRAFRGIARICAVESVPEEWTVAFRGTPVPRSSPRLDPSPRRRRRLAKLRARIPPSHRKAASHCGESQSFAGSRIIGPDARLCSRGPSSEGATTLQMAPSGTGGEQGGGSLSLPKGYSAPVDSGV